MLFLDLPRIFVDVSNVNAQLKSACIHHTISGVPKGG